MAAKNTKEVNPYQETSDDEETIEAELTNTSTEPRKLRVYKPGGDFFLDLPPGCRVTFGYFNPSAAGISGDSYGRNGRGMDTMKTTALRIYEGRGDKSQLACFLGVSGFRDEAIKLTKIVERVTIERHMADDGEGVVQWGGSDKRQVFASPEPEFELETGQEDTVF